MSAYLLRPSAAERWVNCPASYMMSLPYPEQETEATREGTEAHALAAEGFLAAFTGLQWYTPQTEMGFAVGQYVNRCLGTPGQARNFEESLPVPSIPECGGTVDFKAIDYGTRTLYIKDFKYGHDPVEAYENWQCMLYAQAQIEALQLDDLAWTVVIEIIQPRCYATRDSHTWRIPAHALRGYINRARLSAARALGENPPAHSGTWCTYCPAVHVCKTALNAGTRLYEAASRGTPHGMPAWALGIQLAIVKRARQQLDTLEAAYTAELLGRVEKENCGPWSMVEEPGRLRWILDDATVAAMVPELCTLKVPTPTQAKDAGVDINGLAERPKTKKLKAVNLPRVFPNAY